MDMDQNETAVSKISNDLNQRLDHHLDSAPSVAFASSTSYESDKVQQVPESVPIILTRDPPPAYCSPNQPLEVEAIEEAVTRSDTSEKNFVAAWVDEFLQMSVQQNTAQVNFPADNVQRTSHQEPKPIPSNPPPSYETAFHQIKQNHQASQEELLPTTITSPPDENEKKHKCHLCNTSYATPTRLKRHFGTKKHKAASEKLETLSSGTSPEPVTQPSRIKNLQTPMIQPEKLLHFSAQSEHQGQQQQKLPHMPQFRPYSEYPHNIDTRPLSSDWPIFHSQLDFLRSSQTLLSPTAETQHAHSNFFYHQPHLNHDIYYNKLSFSSLCNSHQSSLSQFQSPQYMPDSVSSADQPRSFVPSANYHQAQGHTSPWYYPVTPYPSPNQYLQRNAYSDFTTMPTSEPYQKYETNNNYFSMSSDTGPNQTVFDQRPFQQEALNLWAPKIMHPALDESIEEVDEISDDSETMSPVLSPDSQYEPVSSTECSDAIAIPEEELPGNEAENVNLRCEQCNRDFSKLCYLTQHNNAIHPTATEIEHPFRCNICDKSYSKLSLLVKHSSKHTGGDKPFKCDVCDKQFGYKVDLTRHKYLHSGNKNFNCHLCPKSCVRKDQLMRHLRAHGAEAENVGK